MNIVWLGEGSVTDHIRLVIPSEEMTERGHESVVVQLPNQPFDAQSILKKQDVAVFCRTHWWDLVGKFRDQGTKIICDIDDDFWSIPKTHPGYAAVGPGNTRAMEAMTKAMEQADLITAASPTLASRMADRFNKPVMVVYNGWSQKMANQWFRKSPPHERVRIGWSGTITHRDDIKLAQKSVQQVVYKGEDADVVIGGDPEIYRLFVKLPEKRKLFVPMVPYEVYPQTLSYFDIGLAPLVNDAFNQAKSDIKLYEFGLRKIPWLASPLPQYKEWAVGGYFATDYSSWLHQLEDLVANPDLRQAFGEMGYEKAQEREARKTADRWLDVFSHVL